METLSVTTANPICITQNNTYIRTANYSGIGKGMSIPIKNMAKTSLTMRNTTHCLI